MSRANRWALAASLALASASWPAEPRLVEAKDVSEAAKKEGFALPDSRADVYPILLDSGRVYSYAPPEAAGPDSIRYLLRDEDGSFRSATAPRSRVREIAGPWREEFYPEGLATLVATLFLPLSLTNWNVLAVLPVFLETGQSGTAAPQFQSFTVEDYFARSRVPYGIGLGMTTAPRGAFYTRDQRLEPVPGIQAEFDAWPRLTAYSASLVVRVFGMSQPLWREPPPFPIPADDYTGGFNAAAAQSAYSAHKLGLALTPAMRIVWAETPGLTVFTRFGTFIAATQYDEQGLLAGPEAALGCEFRINSNWGLRAEADWLGLVHRDWDLIMEPAAGFSVAYRFQPRPLPSYQPPVAMSVLISEGPFGGASPTLQIDKRIATAFDAGLEMNYSSGKFRTFSSSSPSDYYQSYSTETTGRISRMEFSFRYSAHTDPARRAWIGLTMGLGMLMTAESDYSRTIEDTNVTTSASGENSTSLGMSFGPEAGLRLAGPLGLRARWRAFGATDVSGFARPAFAVGLEYRIPARGARR